MASPAYAIYHPIGQPQSSPPIKAHLGAVLYRVTLARLELQRRLGADQDLAADGLGAELRRVVDHGAVVGEAAREGVVAEARLAIVDALYGVSRGKKWRKRAERWGKSTRNDAEKQENVHKMTQN